MKRKKAETTSEENKAESVKTKDKVEAEKAETTSEENKAESVKTKVRKIIKSVETKDKVEETVGDCDEEAETKDKVEETNQDGEIRKTEKDADLFYVEGGSDFEDNLAEKWKNLTDGTRLKRLKFISYLLG